jgi:oligopeptide/dipeptide ABC transporter ATP-binding protein
VPALLHISALGVQYPGIGGRIFHALNGASLCANRGEVVGLLGESGCGKSTIAKACLRLLPRGARITAGEIEFDGKNLLRLTEREMQKVRGAQISLIWQEPSLALSPVMRVGQQVAEVLRAHRSWNAKRRKEEAEVLFGRVGLSGGERRIFDAYPHELSGGQQQRVAIVQALACAPALVIADEPTASLDSETEEEILHLLRVLTAESNLSLLLITHDPRILIGLADRVAVMYGGRIIEEGPLEQVFCRPFHPYTKALLACIPPAPSETRPNPAVSLPTVAGSAPDPELVSECCTFSPRCGKRMEVCDVRRPVAVAVASGHVECFLHGG